MAKNQTFVIRAMVEIGRILDSTEEAQAQAAALAQQFTDVGGDAYLSGVNWNQAGVDETDFKDAMQALPLFLAILNAQVGTTEKTVGQALYLVKS